jgi:ATP diphosphatase
MTESRQATERLLERMGRLRDPEAGCPWDREQDFSTIAPYTIEAAYEVAEAIRGSDPQALKEELGVLLFRVVFHAHMAREAGWFDFDDVSEAASDKMTRRHPHLFGDAVIDTAAAQTRHLEDIKAEEHHTNAGAVRASRLEGVPRSNACRQAPGPRGAGAWPDAAGIFDKLDEEVDELKEALADGSGSDRHAKGAGDVLFTFVNLARRLGIDPETALRGANAKFERRFRYVETALAAEGQGPESVTLAAMDVLWDQAKKRERK